MSAGWLEIASWLVGELQPMFPSLCPHLSTGTPLVRIWTGPIHAITAFIWVSALSRLEDIVSSASSIFSGSYSLSASFSTLFPEPWGEEMIKTSCLGLNVSFSAQCTVVDLCISSRLLQQGASQTLTEGDTNLWGNSVAAVVIVLRCSFCRTALFGFLLGPWSIESQILGHLSSVRPGFHLKECALHPQIS